MDTDEIKRAIKTMADGGTIVFPTDTLYALGAIATNGKAIQKIYAIKKRPTEKLLPVIVGSRKQAEKYFIFTRAERALAKEFWPGPLSLILKTKSRKLARAMGSDMFAVRHPADPVAVILARLLGVPIVSTSANLSGKPGCFSVAAVKRQFARAKGSSQPDMFLDRGTLKKSMPSTIVQIKDKNLIVIREGKIPFSKIQKVFAPYKRYKA